MKAADILDRAAQRIEAKLAGNTLTALPGIWDTWSPEIVTDFHTALVAWHDGGTYIHTEEKEMTGTTPLDTFAEKHPIEWKTYSDAVASGSPKINLFRTVMFEQADDIVTKLVNDADENLLGELWSGLEWQNQLHFRTKPVSNESFVNYDFEIAVRRFSSWTSQANVAYMLSHEGGQYQIGDGAVLVRTSNNPRVVHTFDAAIAFERWCQTNKEKAPDCSPFMARWKWQVEYVVEAHGPIKCDGLEVVGAEGASDGEFGYYETIKQAAGYADDEDYV